MLSTCLLRRLAAGAAAVVLGLGPMQAAAASAAAGPHQNETPTARLVDFDLPVMALKDALARYSLLTRYSVLFESDMVTGKQSASVRGGHTAEAALSRLLAGTGLVPRFLNRHSVALVPAGQPRGTSAATDRPYGVRLQHRIAASLCAVPQAGAGRERIALRFGVNGDGRIDRLKVSVPTRRSAEAAARQALAGLHVGTPPVGMPQPFVMIVSPDAARLYGGCGS